MGTSGKTPHVVILGGGFGGLAAARALSRAPVRLTLIDRKNHHLFQPLLYQVAAAALNPSDIATPIRRILRRQKNVTVILDKAIAIDVAQKRVCLADGTIDYDFLIVATGATHAYFGHPEWARAAPGLKTIEDALEIRRRLLSAYEAAERETDLERQRAWMTFAIVGAGPTGVELAGALAEISRQVLARDFRRIDPRAARIVLVEAGPRVLPTFAPDLSQRAADQLRRLGVEVRMGTAVTTIDEHGLALGDERIEAKTVLWAAGVAASPIAQSLGVPLDRAGRVRVEPTLAVPGAPDVYVIGDLAAVSQAAGQVPGVAQGAIQGGRHAAKNILNTLVGRPRVAFCYRDLGSLATIGRAAAVAQFSRVHLSGFIAWLAWLFIHLMLLIGFRNRFLVLTEWAWTYFTRDHGARLITGSERES